MVKSDTCVPVANHLNKLLELQLRPVRGLLGVNDVSIDHCHLHQVIENPFVPLPRSIRKEVRFAALIYQVQTTHMLAIMGNSRWTQNLTNARRSVPVTNVHRGTGVIVQSTRAKIDWCRTKRGPAYGHCGGRQADHPSSKAGLMVVGRVASLSESHCMCHTTHNHCLK